MKRSVLYSGIIASILFGGIQSAVAQKPVGIDFFTQVRSVSNVKTIGNDVFFTIRQASTKDDKYTTNLYQLVDGKAKQLTNSGRFGGYDVLDNAIVFRTHVDGATAFLELTRSYGEASEWLRLPYKIGQVKFISRTRFFFTASHTLQQAADGLPDSLKAKDADKRYRIFDELPFWSNGRGDINGQRSVLYEYNNGSITPLTDSTSVVGGFTLSPDHHYLAYTINDKRNFRSYGNSLYLRDISNGKVKQISIADCTGHGSLTFIDSQHLFVTARPYNAVNPQANSAFYSIDIASGKSKQIYNGNRYDFGVSILSDVKSSNHSEPIIEKNGLVYNTTAVDYAPLVRLSFAGGDSQLLTPVDFDVDDRFHVAKRVLHRAVNLRNATERIRVLYCGLCLLLQFRTSKVCSYILCRLNLSLVRTDGVKVFGKRISKSIETFERHGCDDICILQYLTTTQQSIYGV